LDGFKGEFRRVPYILAIFARSADRPATAEVPSTSEVERRMSGFWPIASGVPPTSANATLSIGEGGVVVEGG
jgi:hypothetical protein